MTKRKSRQPSYLPPFVLLHGAWHGAWCWQQVRRLLQAQGHDVFTPTFTGMGALHHLSAASVNLSTHTQDVVATLESEELLGAIVVAHSYAGYPATAALNHMALRVARLIYLDALLPTPGKASADFWPAPAVAAVRAGLLDGYRLAPFPAAAFGVPPGHPQHDWVQRRLTDMPFGALEQAFPATPAINRLPVPATYVRCTLNSLDDTKFAAQQATQARLPMVDLEAAHDAMVTAPAALAQLLQKLARPAST